MKLYIINYEFDHKIWSAYFPCESWVDAEKRLAALKATGQVDSDDVLKRAPLVRLTVEERNRIATSCQSAQQIIDAVQNAIQEKNK